MGRHANVQTAGPQGSRGKLFVWRERRAGGVAISDYEIGTSERRLHEAEPSGGIFFQRHIGMIGKIIEGIAGVRAALDDADCEQEKDQAGKCERKTDGYCPIHETPFSPPVIFPYEHETEPFHGFAGPRLGIEYVDANIPANLSRPLFARGQSKLPRQRGSGNEECEKR